MAYKEVRRVKMTEQTGYTIPDRRPALKLQGKWLAELNFNIGDYVDIKCEENRLIITKVPENA